MEEAALECRPDEIAGEDRRRPAGAAKADPEENLGAMRPGRTFTTRKSLDEKGAKPAEARGVSATGHMGFQSAARHQYGRFVSFVQRNHAEIRNTT